MNSKQIIQKIAEQIVEAKEYSIQVKSPLRQHLIPTGKTNYLFIEEVETPREDELIAGLVDLLAREFKALKTDEAFTVLNWTLAKEVDHDRVYTDEERESIYKYGYAITSPKTNDQVFTNNTTGEVTVISRKHPKA